MEPAFGRSVAAPQPLAAPALLLMEEKALKQSAPQRPLASALPALWAGPPTHTTHPGFGPLRKPTHF